MFGTRELAVTLCAFITAAFCQIDYEAEVKQRPNVTASRTKAYQWLLSERNKDWGWGTRNSPQTHRMLTALYLSGELQNATDSLEYQLSVKQLELELSLALARKKGKISPGQLALYANALLATCKNPNDFYGHNIIKVMRPRKKLSTYAEALVSLAVSNSGNKLTKKEVMHYFELLDKYANSTQVFLDTKAMITLALSSAANYMYQRFFSLYLRHTLKSFKESQREDGSFGNIYSSALVVQALIGAKDKGTGWDFQKAMDYILSQQKEGGSFGDLLATYFVLPVLAGKSLVNLRRVSCESVNETDKDDGEEETMINGTIAVRYSVRAYKVDLSDIFTVPEGSSFFDVMVVAAKVDKRYRFNGTSYSWGYFVQKIGSIRNDQICNKYWTLYKRNMETGEMMASQYGVKKEIPQNGDHYMFRYEKSIFFQEDGVTCNDNQEDSGNSTISTMNVSQSEGLNETTDAN